MDAAPSSSHTSFSGSGNFSFQFIPLAILLSVVHELWVCECDCVCCHFQCFSSINKTVAINLNIGRRFHAKRCLAFASVILRANASYRRREIRNLNLLDSSETIAMEPWMRSTNTINVFIVSVRNVKYGHRIPAHWQRVSDLRQRKRGAKRHSLACSLCLSLSHSPSLSLSLFFDVGCIYDGTVHIELCTFDGNPVEFDFVFQFEMKTQQIVQLHNRIFPFSGNSKKRNGGHWKCSRRNSVEMQRRRWNKYQREFDKFCARYNYMVCSPGRVPIGL